MKKNILFLILLLSFFIGNKIIKAEESVVYSTDNMEISSDSFTTFNEKLNLIKGSNLFVKLIAQEGVDYEAVEPKLNIEILDNQNNTVWTASNPKTKAPDPQKQPDEFDKYLEKNKNFFKAVSFTKSVLNIKVPLNINGGEYRLKITSTNYPKISVDYKFILSNSAYNFTDTQILVEDLDVYANIGYESKLEKEENNKVVISVSQSATTTVTKFISKNVNGSVNTVVSISYNVIAGALTAAISVGFRITGFIFSPRRFRTGARERVNPISSDPTHKVTGRLTNSPTQDNIVYRIRGRLRNKHFDGN